MNTTWAKRILLTLTEHGAVRVLDALFTFLLIRLLDPKDFGLFSVYQSWVLMLLLALPSLEQALYREYSHLKASDRLSIELKFYRAFNFAKILLGAIFVFGLSFVPAEASLSVRVSLLGLALALPVSQALYGLYREPLRFELKQGLVAGLSLLQRLALISSCLVCAYLFPRNALALSVTAMAVYFLFGGIWAYSSRALFADPSGVVFKFSEASKKVLAILGTTVLWIHLNGVVSQFVQNLDVFFLNWFRVPLDEIGLYGIALKGANFFQLVPMALANSFGVYLARGRHLNDHKKELQNVMRFSILFLALCLILFAAGLWLGLPLITFLGKGKLNPETASRGYEYFYWQLAGILILCSAYPMTTYLSIRAELSKIFFWITLPYLLLSVGLYAKGASLGPIFAAKANVLVYTSNVVFLWIFFIKYRLKIYEQKS